MNRVKTVDNNIKFVVGERALENIAYEISTAGCMRPMLVCDDMSNRVGLKRTLLKAFDGSDMDIAYIDQKIGDIPTTEDVERIVRQYISTGCDCMVLLGKKAVISAGKASKILIRDGVSLIAQYDGKNISKFPVKDFPLFVVPTYLGSAIECSNKVRIYNPEANITYDFDSAYAQTSAVFMDARMTDTMPPKSIASFGMFALALAVEGYTKSQDKVFAKPYSMTALKILKDSLMPCIFHNAESRYRKEIMSAVVIAGCGYYLLDKGLLSVLTDVISDRYKANYANIFALLFREYIKQSNTYDEKLLGELAPCFYTIDQYCSELCDDLPKAVRRAIEGYYSRIEEYVEVTGKLRDFGVLKEDFPQIAEQAIQEADVTVDEEFSYAFIMSLLESVY